MKYVLMTFFIVLAFAQAQEAFVGNWQGEIGPGVLNLGVVVHFTASGETLSGTIDIPAQGAEGLALAVTKASNDKATFSIEGVPGNPTFEGTLESGKISGTFSQSSQSFDFSLEPLNVETSKGPATINTYLGNWQGVIGEGKLDLKIGLIFEDKNGIMEGNILIPAQSFEGALKIDSLSEDSITLIIQGIPGNPTLKGTLEADLISGTFSQNGTDFDFSVERSEEAISSVKPQDPVEPYPYLAEELSFKSGDISIAGTLTLPEGKGPFPAVIMITGSGPQNRNEELMGHRPFLVLADAITRAGFAVLRTDDRGIGGTGGKLDDVSYDDLAKDVLSEIDFLKARADIDPERIGLFGHSEGGYIAPLVASQSEDVAFVIMMAGPSVSGLEVLELQTKLIMEQAGAPEDEITKQLEYLQLLGDALNREAYDEAKALAEARMKDSFASAPEAERPSEEAQAQIIEAQVSGVVTPYFRSLVLFDPQKSLSQIKVPLLAFYGSKDIQVNAEQSVEPLKEYLKEAKNEDVTVQTFEGLNHLMQPATTGSVTEYSEIETTIEPEVLELVTNWLKERFLKN